MKHTPEPLRITRTAFRTLTMTTLAAAHGGEGAEIREPEPSPHDLGSILPGNQGLVSPDVCVAVAV